MARYQFRFWLDCDKDDQLLLADAIDDLKHQRAWAGTIRDALRLVLDLRAGGLDVLFELFPWVMADLNERVEARARAAADAHITGQLARLERLLAQQGGAAGPRPMALPKVGGRCR